MFGAFPANCPDTIRKGLGQHQFTEIFTGQQFNTTVKDMVEIRIKPLISEQASGATDDIGAIIHLETDLDCQILKFGKLFCTTQIGEDKIIRLRKGKHKLEFVSIENPTDCYSTIFSVEDNEMEDILSIELKSIRDKRVKEEEETQRLLNIPDKEIVSFEDKITSKYGFKVESTGEIIISPKYDHDPNVAWWHFNEGLARVNLNGKFGFIDKTGKEVIPLIYNDVYDFSEGLARVEFDNCDYGYIDKTGKVVITCEDYDDVDDFSEGLAPVELDDQYGYIDKTGKEVIPCIYDYAWSFCEGLASVKLNEKWGFIDKTGKEVIPCIYERSTSFINGLAGVKLNEKWGFIDKTGKEIIPFIYDYLWTDAYEDPFYEGEIRVILNGEEFLIDKTGKRIS